MVKGVHSHANKSNSFFSGFNLSLVSSAKNLNEKKVRENKSVTNYPPSFSLLLFLKEDKMINDAYACGFLS